MPQAHRISSSRVNDWTEDDELDFLSNLGRNVYQNAETCSRLRGVTRTQLLERYVAASSWRASWGNIRPKRILAACQSMLQEEIGTS